MLVIPLNDLRPSKGNSVVESIWTDDSTYLIQFENSLSSPLNTETL